MLLLVPNGSAYPYKLCQLIFSFILDFVTLSSFEMKWALQPFYSKKKIKISDLVSSQIWRYDLIEEIRSNLFVYIEIGKKIKVYQIQKQCNGYISLSCINITQINRRKHNNCYKESILLSFYSLYFSTRNLLYESQSLFF